MIRDKALDFVVVRKIGCPDDRELGVGAITPMTLQML
jgi:predicted phosphoribosyltransferase